MQSIAYISLAWLPTTLQPIHIGLLISVAIFFITLLVGRGVIAREAVRRRALDRASLDCPIFDSEHQSIGHETRRRTALLVDQAAKLLAPTDQQALSAVRKQMLHAGYFSASAPSVYYAVRIVLAFLLPTFFIAFGNGLPVQISGAITLLGSICLAALGLIGPSIFLDWRKSKVQGKYRNTFPDFMDLMVVCVEAGQSLQGAIDRVGREVTTSCPELGANLHLLSLELRAGRSLTDGLAGLAERLGIEEVRSLTVLLKQSEELGTSLATSLRVYSDEMRDKRMMRAEAKAQSLPVKMVIPLGLFIFPVILMVVMLPLIIRIRSTLL